MAYTTINKSSEHFNTKLYTGAGTGGSPFSLTGVGFAPDWTWIKRRDGVAIGHRLFDRVRGATKYIDSSATSAETTNTSTLTAFGSDGFTLQNEGSVNDGSALFTSWNWKANGQGSSNTDGSINTTYTSANTTAGFSISKYTGTGSAGATFGHGLGSKPAMIIFKCLSVAGPSWVVYHQSKGATYTLYLDQTSAGGASAEMLNNTEPTSSLITLGNGTSSNSSGAPTIAYCFAEKTGYSKFGSYEGNNNINGTFIYLGFKPAFLIIKAIDNARNWMMYDNKRGLINVNDETLYPNADSAEVSPDNYNGIDFLSNGFKLRGGSSGVGNDTNGAETYIYMAFAEAPLVGTNNVPCTAR